MVWCALQFFTIYEKNGSNCIKFCVKNESKCAKTFEMLTVPFGKSTMSKPKVQLLYTRFKEGREDVNDDAREQPMKTLKQ